MFMITEGKGFHIAFKNGYRLSVQWGYGSYSDNRDSEMNWTKMKDIDRVLGANGSTTAEIAIMDPNGNFCGQELGIIACDDVEGYCSPERVAEVMNLVANLP